MLNLLIKFQLSNLVEKYSLFKKNIYFTFLQKYIYT